MNNVLKDCKITTNVGKNLLEISNFFTKWCHRQTYQNYEQRSQRLQKSFFSIKNQWLIESTLKLGINPIPTRLGHVIPPLAGRNRVKELLNKEQIGNSEPFAITNLPFKILNTKKWTDWIGEQFCDDQKVP